MAEIVWRHEGLCVLVSRTLVSSSGRSGFEEEGLAVYSVLSQLDCPGF
jgi:hypothetical protein